MKTLRTAAYLLLLTTSCGGCDDSQDPPVVIDVSFQDSGGSDAGSDSGTSDMGQLTDMDGTRDAGSESDMPATSEDAGGEDLGVDADAGLTEDLGPPDVCGDGAVTGPEACDDGNTADGDYCDASCTAVTGSCGDGTVQANEYCDDGVTTDCIGTHDGGDQTCVPAGTCAAGYVLSQGNCVSNPTGLTVPCSNGPGWTLFRYHYSNNSTSAQINVWDATCSYSFAPNSACNVQEICPGFCDPPVTSDGYPIFDTSDYMRVRFNVNGLNFSQATLWVQARSYATSSSTRFRVWSPLYGETFSELVDQDFVYDWYEVDWTGYLYPNDSPSLTAIQLYGANGNVAVKAVEMCVQ